MRKLLSIILIINSVALMAQTFEKSTIPTDILREMKQKGTISDEAPVQADRLSYLKMSYVDFNGKEHVGEMVIMDVLAESVLSIFRELYERQFPIEKMQLITRYDGDDDASMADNNNSAHNYRKVAGSGRLSLHAYGTAIDINPVQNPYILFEEGNNLVKYLPPNSISYANRLIHRLGKSRRLGFAEEVVEVFARHGFYWWGGYWDTPIDYQHFQLDREVSYVLAKMNKDQALWFFDILKNYYNEHQKPLESILKDQIEISLSEHFQKDPSTFKKWVLSNY